MTMAIELVEKLILPAERGRILCAVSGGADSLCLLHLLQENRDALGITLCAAHFEHGIRGEESLRDAAFVQVQCQTLGIELRVGHGDVPHYAEETHMGMEEAARTLRYRFLEETADALGCVWIATAHNADDNAETLLFHLIRGSGTKGLCGIPAQRGRIIRPLLQVSRREIEHWLTQRELSFVNDSSNESDEYSRNRLRHQVMPVLRTLNPKALEAMGRTARLLQQDEDCLSSLAGEFLQAHYDGKRISSKALLALHPAVASRVLRQLCPQPLQENHVRAILSLAEGTERGYAHVPGSCIRREQGFLWFAQEEATEIPARRLFLGEATEIPELQLEIMLEKSCVSGEIHGLFKTYEVKCESICGNLICSSPRPGDKLRIRERGCTKSLKAIFTEKKMTRSQRRLCLVIRDDRGVVLVPDFGIDSRCLPEKGDKTLRVVLRKKE